MPKSDAKGSGNVKRKNARQGHPFSKYGGGPVRVTARKMKAKSKDTGSDSVGRSDTKKKKIQKTYPKKVEVKGAGKAAREAGKRVSEFVKKADRSITKEANFRKSFSRGR